MNRPSASSSRYGLDRAGSGHCSGLGRHDGEELVADELGQLPILGNDLLLDDAAERLEGVVGLDLVSAISLL